MTLTNSPHPWPVLANLIEGLVMRCQFFPTMFTTWAFAVLLQAQTIDQESTLPEVVVEPAPARPAAELLNRAEPKIQQSFPSVLQDSSGPITSFDDAARPYASEIEGNQDVGNSLTNPRHQSVTNLSSSNRFASSSVSGEATRPSLDQLRFGQPNDFSGATGILRGGSTLFDSPVAGSILTRQELIEKQSSSTFDALQQEVGILMQRTSAGQGSPFIRGVTGQQVLLLVDGIRLNNSIYRFGPNQYFNTIDAGQIDHVEVLRGQGSVLWGSDAIGGAINVVTRSPQRGSTPNEVDYVRRGFRQSFNTANSESYSRLNFEGWSGDWGLFGGGSYLNARDLDTGFDFGRQPGTNYDQYAGDLKLNLLLSDHELLSVATQHFEQNDVPRSDRFPGYPGDLNNSNSVGGARFFDPQTRDLVYIRYESVSPFEFSDAIVATASYHRQRETQTRGIPMTRFQETEVESVGFNLLSTKDFGFYGKATAGVDWYHDDVDSDFGGAASGPIVPDDAFYERFGVFFHWDVSLTERLDAIAGARYEQIDVAATPTVNGNAIFIDSRFDDWIGQIGLVYELSTCMHLVGSISEGFRAPNLDELTANSPNVLQDGEDLPSLSLVPETSTSYEVGIKTNYQRLRSQLFVYWLDLQDNAVPIAVGANQFARANQDSSIQGTEFDGEYLLDQGWSLYGNLTYTFGRNDVILAPLSRVPPTQGVFGLRWRDRQLRSYFSVYAWMVRDQDRLDPIRDLSDERIPDGGTPGFTTLNVRMGTALGPCRQHRISLNLENITDKAYLVHGSGVFGSGFSARFGYAVDF